jgi:predicted RNA-binding Zn-ribbon protein involved in translation (DUF1610 family)
MTSLERNLERKLYCSCGELIEPERLAIGRFICLDCGERDAQIEKERKAKSIVPAYNKGAYTYISNVKDLKGLDSKHRL